MGPAMFIVVLPRKTRNMLLKFKDYFTPEPARGMNRSGLNHK